MASMFDSAMFNPQSFSGTGGLLGNILKMIQANPTAAQGFDQSNTTMQPQVGPTMAQGDQGQMGGVPFPIFGQQQQQQQADIPQNAQPTQGVMPQQSQGLGPLLGGQPSGGGLFGGIQNKMRDMAGILNPQIGALNTQKQALNSSYQALVNSGVPEPMARAAALNPEILKTIAPNYFAPAKLQKTGTDPLTGQDSFATYNPNNPGVLKPVNGGQPSGGASAPMTAQTIFDDIQKKSDAGVPQDQIIGGLPNSIRGPVAAMLEGKALPTNYSMRGQARDMALRIAHAIDPTFDETLIPQRTKFATGMGQTTPNSPGGQKILMNTALGHAGEMADAVSELKNSNGPLPTWLPGSNMVAHGINNFNNSSVEKGGTINKINDIAQKLAGEVGRLYSSANGGGETERLATMERFSSAKTPAEFAGALEATRNLIKSKLSALENERDQVYGARGANIYPLLDQHAQDAIAKMDAAIPKLKSGVVDSNSTAPDRGALEAEMRRRGLLH